MYRELQIELLTSHGVLKGQKHLYMHTFGIRFLHGRCTQTLDLELSYSEFYKTSRNQRVKSCSKLAEIIKSGGREKPRLIEFLLGELGSEVKHLNLMLGGCSTTFSDQNPPFWDHLGPVWWVPDHVEVILILPKSPFFDLQNLWRRWLCDRSQSLWFRSQPATDRSFVRSVSYFVP